jgi:prepilin-type N-terminal cleavage/methylation domain-containing protein
MFLKVTRVTQIFVLQGVLMKRAGFTMIELIFVIVILGILAAVALPKFIGVSEQANAGKCEAMYGTLNRTVGPMMWSASLSGTDTNDTNGSVNDLVYTNYAQDAFDTGCGLASPFAASGSVTFGNNTYDVNFTDGTVNEAPRWAWARQ